jgi:hypothetical protein
MEPQRKHAAIDLETASLAYNAAVLTIGLVIFDPMADESTDLKYHWVVPQHYNNGADVDLGTVKWWMQQSEAARSQAWLATPDLDPMHPPFLNIIQMLDEVEHIWANDPDADCQWMKELYKRIGVQWKHYRKHRSIRTLRAMYSELDSWDVNTVQHNALNDAKWNTAIVRNVYNGQSIPTFGRHDPYRAVVWDEANMPREPLTRRVAMPPALGAGYGSSPVDLALPTDPQRPSEWDQQGQDKV